MRKLVVNVLIFGLSFLVIIRVMGNWDNTDSKKSINPNIVRMQQAHLFDSLDILFIGSSASYSGINPAYFDSAGLRTYNLGLAAAGPFFYELLLNDYIASVKQKPATVFFLIMPSTFMSRIDRFDEIGIHRYLFSPISNERLVKRFGLWNIYPSLLVKSFQKGVKNLIHIDKVSDSVWISAQKNKGFYPSDEITSPEKEQKEALSYNGWKRDSFSVAKYEYLLRYAASIQQKGMKVVFFSLPGNQSAGFFNRQYIEKYQENFQHIKSIYKVYDLSALLLDSSCYRNSDHLNSKGAARVSNELISLMQKDYEARNHSILFKKTIVDQ